MNLILDGEKISSKDELHKLMESVLDFPEWYGRNLDALYDCLTDLTEEVDIQLQNAEAFHRNLGDYADKVLWVLKDAEQTNLNIQLIIN